MTSRSRAELPIGPSEFESFSSVLSLLKDRFREAVATNVDSDRYTFFTIDSRQDAEHTLGVFSLANSFEDMRKRRGEVLEFALPIERADITMPMPILGPEASAHYFYMGYVAKRGGPKTLRIDEAVYTKRFTKAGNAAPVKDLAQKLLTYQVIPMRQLIDG